MTAIKQAIEALQESLEFFQSYSVGAMSRNNAESMALEALPKVTAALAALRAQPAKLFTSKDMEREFEDGMRREAEIWKPRLDAALQQLRFMEDQNRAILTRVADLTAFQVPTIHMTLPPTAQPDHSELVKELRYVADWAQHHLDKAQIIKAAADALEGKV